MPLSKFSPRLAGEARDEANQWVGTCGPWGRFFSPLEKLSEQLKQELHGKSALPGIGSRSQCADRAGQAYLARNNTCC